MGEIYINFMKLLSSSSPFVRRYFMTEADYRAGGSCSSEKVYLVVWQSNASSYADACEIPGFSALGAAVSSHKLIFSTSFWVQVEVLRSVLRGLVESDYDPVQCSMIKYNIVYYDIIQ